MNRSSRVAPLLSVALVAAASGCFADPLADDLEAGDSVGDSGSEATEADATSEDTTDAESGTEDAETTTTESESEATDTDETEDADDTETSSPACGDGEIAVGELCLSTTPDEFAAGQPLQDGFKVHVAVGEFDPGVNGVVAVFGQPQASVLRGDGSGGLEAAELLDLGSLTDGVAVGDLEPDGDVDFVAGGSPLTAMRNDGNGGWLPVEIEGGFLFGSYPIALAQFDASPQLDVVFAEGYNTVWVLGDSQGGWSPGDVGGAQWTGGDSWLTVTEFGFDGDGFMDLVVASRWTPSLAILRGNGNGTFTSQGQIDACEGGGCDILELHAADLDGDGNPDLIASTSVGLSVLLGTDEGTFVHDQIHDIPGVDRVDSADIDNDGNIDLAVASRADGDIRVLLGDGAGDFAAPLVLEVPGDSTQTVAFADMNGDGALEVVTGYAYNGGGWVAVFANDP